MTKSKKIAAVAVSTVMAGTLVFSLTGCGPKDSWDLKLDGNKLTWTEGTTINMNVGNQNSTSAQGIKYLSTDISGTTVLPDGKSYAANQLKPAWQALQSQLKVTFEEKYQNLSSDEQIKTPVTNKNIGEYDVISGSLQAIVENKDNFIDISEYLDYMPNYKAFLDANPVTKYSLTGDASGAMYAAPYFDGNDDIEKYTLANRNWVTEILETADLGAKGATTFKAQAAAKSIQNLTAAKATAFMTADYKIKTTKPGSPSETVWVKVDHAAALTAAQDSQSELSKALTAAHSGLDVSTLTSGNIVDLQNAVINGTNGEVTGAQLAKILREYVKVAYKYDTTENGTFANAFYDGAAFGSTTTKLSDVFNSAWAAWDVDLLVGISRCIVTFGKDLTASNTNAATIWAIAGRETTTQRRIDLQALAGELYGVRGMESRYEYTYFNKDGQLNDARVDEKSYEALSRMSALTQEGLVYVGNVTTTTDSDGKVTVTKGSAQGAADSKNAKQQTFLMHDFSQTQTKAGIGKAMTAYNFAPIVNAVSKWDDGTGAKAMRFTESWRSVKNTGFCIPKEAVKNNPDKFSAVLGFIDYLFSPDGQLLMTYGPRSTTGNTNPDGWWYATEATGVALDSVADKITDATNYAPAQYKMKAANKADYFVYQGKVYTGFAYNGTQVPQLTDANLTFYSDSKGITVNGTTIKQGEGNILIKQIGNYTNYARYFLGTTLPIGNKNQGFEYQATAACGIDGANVVNVALQNGTLQHVKLTLTSGESPWYLIAPTALPLTEGHRKAMKSDNQTKISGTYFLNNSKTDQITNIYIDLLYYGLGSSNDICGKSELGNYATTNTGAKIVALLGQDMQERQSISQTGWKTLNRLYNLGYSLG